MKKKEVIKWVSWEEIEKNPYQVKGFFNNITNGYWEIEDFTEEYEEAIIRALIYNNLLICGDTHQVKCIPVFENDGYIMLSMRKWGELMAAAEEIRDSDNFHTYFEYYMACTCLKEERLPHEE